MWRWFKSYITRRTQRVVIAGYESYTIVISSGVPQGSILGPLLFIMYINDVNQCFKYSKFLLYADDLKIFYSINNDQDKLRLQEDLDRFSLYCSQNSLTLSLDKCKVITYTRKRKFAKHSYTLCQAILSRVDVIRDLGIILDSKLKLDLHVDTIVSKAYKMYGFVMRACKSFKCVTTLLYLFKSLIRSQVEYCVPVWDPLYKKYIKVIERIQHKFLRCVNFKFNGGRLSYNQLLVKYRLLDLKSRREQLQFKILYDLIHNKYDCNNLINKITYNIPHKTHRRSSRKYNLFATKFCRTDAGRRSPLYRLLNTFNCRFGDIDIFKEKPGICKRLVIKKLKSTVDTNNRND